MKQEEMEKKILELEATLNKVSQDALKEIIQLKLSNHNATIKIEALTRSLMVGKSITTIDDFINTVAAYKNLVSKIRDILKMDNVRQRVTIAQDFNNTNPLLPIFIDDLELIPKIEAAGGTSQETAQFILNAIPYGSSEVKKQIQKFATIEVVLHPDEIQIPVKL